MHIFAIHWAYLWSLNKLVLSFLISRMDKNLHYRTMDRQTDRQADFFIPSPPPPNIVLGVIIACHHFSSIHSLPNNKILDLTKLKAFADDKLNIAKTMIFLYDRAESTVGKGENAGYQHFLLFPLCFLLYHSEFLLFPLCFPKPSSLGSLKVGTVWYRVKAFITAQYFKAPGQK